MNNDIYKEKEEIFSMYLSILCYIYRNSIFLIKRLDNKVKDVKASREKNAKEQFAYVKDNEINVEGTLNTHFREYLMEYVVPNLTAGLLEVTQLRPQDPVEFLAEYIFKKSFEL